MSDPKTKYHTGSIKLISSNYNIWAIGLQGNYQGMTSFLLQSCLGVLPTLISDTFGILQTPTASQFWRHFGVLPIPSPFQQSPTLLHAPSTPTPPPKATLRPPPPPKVTQRPLWTPHLPIQTPLWHSSETLWVIAEIGWLPQHPIWRVASLR